MKSYTRIAVSAVAVMAVSLHAVAQDQATDATFRAGAATADITPWFGLSIAGHMRDRSVSYIHDELHVRSLVLDDGETVLGFAIVDSCMVPRHVFDGAKSLIEQRDGIPATNLLMAATHTHSAACATPVFQSDPDPEYQRFLVRRIADAVSLALQNRRPAQLAWGRAHAPEHVFNRRWFMEEGHMPDNPFGEKDTVKMNPPRGSEALIEPAGPTDPGVPFFAVQTNDGRPIALLANYALHYVGGTGGGGHVSADYFGMFANTVAAQLDPGDENPPFVAMLTNGASGDINNIDFREPAPSRKPYEQMRYVAEDVAGKILDEYKGLNWRDWVPLAAAQEEISLGVRKPTDEQLEWAETTLAGAGPDLTTLPEIYARETRLLADYPAQVGVLLQTLQIGDLAIAAIPCEVFVEIGLEIKGESRHPMTMLIELANGYNGYLPTPKHHELGGYETWRARSSYLVPHASEMITKTLLSLLSTLE